MTRAVPVLMYHHVSPNPGLVTVSPATFDSHMGYLARRGYRALRASELLDFLQGRREVPNRSVVVTFDDGYLDNYVHAYPALLRHGLSAIVFAITGLMGEGPPRPHGETGAAPPTPDHRGCKAAIAAGRADEVMLRWSELETMQARGAAEAHSHTHRHERWDELHPDAAARLEALERDLAASRVALKARLGADSRHLCWPWGRTGPGYRETAARLGFDAQYGSARGVNVAGSDPARIARIAVKDAPPAWLARQLAIFSNSTLGKLYSRLRGRL